MKRSSPLLVASGLTTLFALPSYALEGKQEKAEGRKLATDVASVSSGTRGEPNAGAQASPFGAVASLSQFGRVDTPANAQAALEAATKAILEAGGGLLVIPPETVAGWTPKNEGQHELRTPPPPAPAKNWTEGPALTILDARGKRPTLHPAPITGLTLRRVLDLPAGESLPHWNYNPVIHVENIVARGSTSYHDWVQEDVEPGENARFYVATIRGLFPGMFINANAWSSVERLYVKSLGYDKEKKAWYVVAETSKPFKKGTLLSNKNHVNAARLETNSHNENQTFDLQILRRNYSQGDNYLVDARFRYMGDIHSTAGDENGVVYAAFIEAEVHPFVGVVDKWDAGAGELRFKKANAQVKTLGSGRPILNMNPRKKISEGSAWIVRPSAAGEASFGGDVGVSTFKGKSYPSTLGPNSLGIKSLRVGGLIRLSADAPVDDACVGRYFAVDQDDESPKGTHVRRWYLIHSVQKNADGTKDLEIVRHWWGAKAAGSPTLYNPENYTFDGHERLLKYAIVPGVNAYDVSRAVAGAKTEPVLLLSPSPFAGSAVDFEPEDPIEQAIGPDPFHPQPFRSWMWDAVPSRFPAAIFDVRNLGEVQRYSVLTAGGGSGSLEQDQAKRWSHTSVFEVLFDLKATSNNGVVFNADVANAAILFKQPNERAQPLQWLYNGGLQKASLSVSPQDGTLKFDGASAAIPGGMTQLGGLSGTSTKAGNLRGLNVNVPVGAREVTVDLPNAEADAQYAVFVETTWMTMHVVGKKTEKGFGVRFSEPAPSEASLHWLLTR